MKTNLIFVLFIFLLPIVNAENLRLKVEANATTQANTPIIFDDPDHLIIDSMLQDSTGKTIALQKAKDGKWTFILPFLAANESEIFEIIPASPSHKTVEAHEKDGSADIIFNNKPVLKYRGGNASIPDESFDPLLKRSGYIHPVFTPTGKIVTDDFPEGHLHHHGIWMAWTKTEFQGRQPDFWNMGQGKGRVDFISLNSTTSGPVFAEISALHRYVDLTAEKPVAVLDETFSVRVYHSTDTIYHLFDIESFQQMIGDDPLKLPTYHYGGLGLRGLKEWNGKESAHFLTSDGLTDRIEANSKPARWYRISGESGGKIVSIAVLCSPENFRAPQPLRIHPEEPFVCFAPQTGGDMMITKEKPYRMKYRFVVADGLPDKDLLDQLWDNFASPPKISWIK